MKRNHFLRMILTFSSIQLVFSAACFSDGECGFDFCNKTNNECQCRFGRDEIDLKKCNEPPSCTITSDCPNDGFQNCINNKCKCKFGYRGGSSDCKFVNECRQDYECITVVDAICVKGWCVCKHAIPKFEADGTLKSCDTSISTSKSCLYYTDCQSFEECSRSRCQCKFGSVKVDSGQYICKSVNYCEDDRQCPQYGHCSLDTKTCECEKEPAAAVDADGKITRCDKVPLTNGEIAAIVGGCIAVVILIAVFVVFYFVDKRRTERASSA